MKPTKTFKYCEHCNEPIEDISPPTPLQYAQSVISIAQHSSILLPKSARDNENNCSVSLDGYYCNSECLAKHIKFILKIL